MITQSGGVTSADAAHAMCEAFGWSITNLQLQKLLYMAHMIYAGRNDGGQLISEAFEAWDYGPVLPNLYKQVKIFGNSPVRNVFFNAKPVDADKQAVIQETAEGFKDYSAARLVAITHAKNGAWDRAYVPSAMGIRIPQSYIVDEYKMWAHD